eukprot:1168035-Amphidinium_carterae.1
MTIQRRTGLSRKEDLVPKALHEHEFGKATPNPPPESGIAHRLNPKGQVTGLIHRDRPQHVLGNQEIVQLVLPLFASDKVAPWFLQSAVGKQIEGQILRFNIEVPSENAGFSTASENGRKDF